MSRAASIEAYRHALADGLIARRHAQIVDIIARRGPMTAGEAFAQLQVEQGATFRHDSNTHARLTELRNMGVLAEVGRVVCSITHRRVAEWDVVVGDPVPQARGLSLREEVRELRVEVESLKAAVAGFRGRHQQAELFYDC